MARKSTLSTSEILRLTRILPRPLQIIALLVILGILVYGMLQSGQSQKQNPLPQITPSPTVTTQASSSGQPDVPYKVVKVVDGDTIDVEKNGQIQRVRLIGINTPEVVDPRQPVQCYGREASAKAKELLFNQEIKLEADASQGDRDAYQRLLRYVILPDGTNFNKYMIAQGYAFEYTYRIPYKFQADFKAAQQQARDTDQGLWSPATCNGHK